MPVSRLSESISLYAVEAGSWCSRVTRTVTQVTVVLLCSLLGSATCSVAWWYVTGWALQIVDRCFSPVGAIESFGDRIMVCLGVALVALPIAFTTGAWLGAALGARLMGIRW